jgi:Fe-S oxidoreductase
MRCTQNGYSDPISLVNKLRYRAISHTVVVRCCGAAVQRTMSADPAAMVAEYNVAQAKRLAAL